VTEPDIVSQGSDRIVVQLPGVKDINRAKDLIGKTAKLEFRFVNDEISPATLSELLSKVKKSGIEYKKGERFSEYVQKINESLVNDLPKGFEIAFSKTMNKVTNEIVNLEPYLLESTSSLTGQELQEASVRIDQEQNRPYVALDFKPTGARIFEEITGKNIGKRLAIVLDGNVYSAPVVQGRIAGGSAQITLGAGDYNTVMTEARDLALVLRAGALPVELVFEEQRIVGPSLGADAISQANIAGVVGSLLVFLFMLVYYKGAGLIACITLLANVLFTLAILLGFGATLTLPGIAGIALTVGMAVDGNIIIYERIREELRGGISPFEAVSNGFNKAFWTILDANLTTALAGLCLLNFGTGPVRGFAVTLLIGIVTTVYTSYFASKVLFDFYVGKKTKTTLSI
jgi:protein-export membrane protein SecD